MTITSKAPDNLLAVKIHRAQGPVIQIKAKIVYESGRGIRRETETEICAGSRVQCDAGGGITLRITNIQFSKVKDRRRASATLAGSGVVP